MTKRLLVAVMLVCAEVLGAQAQLDPQTGLWFPFTEIRAGRRAEAVQILSYLKGQPEDAWQSPVAVDVTDDCPPRS